MIFRQRVGKNPDLQQFREKVKEKERQLRDLTREKQVMADLIEKLKRNNLNLNIQVRSQRTVKDQYNSLRALHAERERLINGMKESVGKQRLKAEAAIQETKYKKLGFLKIIGKLTEQLRKLAPSFKDVSCNDLVTKELEDQICAHARSLELQLEGLKARSQPLEEEVQRLREENARLTGKAEKLRAQKGELQDAVELASKLVSKEPISFKKKPTGETKEKMESLVKK